VTTVVAKRTKRGVTFASDGQATWGTRAIPGVVKVFENGPVVFGLAGSVRDLNLLQYVLKMPKQTKADEANPYAWMVGKVIPAIQKVLGDGGNLNVSESQETSESHLLFSVSGLAGYIGSDFAVTGVGEPFWAVGSGAPYALGALACGASADQAVAVASMFDVFTGPPSHKVKVTW